MIGIEIDDLFYVPKFICSICAGSIDDISLGAVVFTDRFTTDKAPIEGSPVHKGECHKMLEKRLENLGESFSWLELQKVANQLAGKEVDSK